MMFSQKFTALVIRGATAKISTLQRLALKNVSTPPPGTSVRQCFTHQGPEVHFKKGSGAKGGAANGGAKGGSAGGKGGKGGAGRGQGQGNGGGWPSTTGNPSGGSRSNNPSK